MDSGASPPAAAAQVHHHRAPEVIPQLVCRADRECGPAGAGLAVQHDHRRPGLGGRAGRLCPVPDPPQLRPPSGERAVGFRELPEGLLQHRAPAGRRALVRAAQRRATAGLLRARGGAEHPLLIEERADAPHFQRGQPLQPELLRAAGLAGGARAVVGGGQVRTGHLHHRRRGAHRGRRDARAEGRAGTGAEAQVGHGGGDGGDRRHQQGRSGSFARVPLAEGQPAGLRLVQRARVGLVLLAGRPRHRVQRAARPRQQQLTVDPSARTPYLLLHGPHQQPLGLRPMTVPHVPSPSGGNFLAYECPSGKAGWRGGGDQRGW